MTGKYLWLMNPVSGMRKADPAVRVRVIEEIELKNGEGLELVACLMDYDFWLWKRK